MHSTSQYRRERNGALRNVSGANTLKRHGGTAAASEMQNDAGSLTLVTRWAALSR